MRRSFLASVALVLCPVALFAGDILSVDITPQPIALGETIVFKAVQDPNKPKFMQFDWFWRCFLPGSPDFVHVATTNSDTIPHLARRVHTQAVKVTGLLPLPQDTEVKNFTVVAPGGETVDKIEPNPSITAPEMLIVTYHTIWCGTKKLGTQPFGILMVRFRDHNTMVWGDWMEVGEPVSRHLLIPPTIEHSITYWSNDPGFAQAPIPSILHKYDQEYKWITRNCQEGIEEFILSSRTWEHVKIADDQWQRHQL